MLRGCSGKKRKRTSAVRVGQSRKRDANEAAIVAALERVGARVMRISQAGAPDLVVCAKGQLFALEVKSATGTPTKAQAAQFQGWPIVTVRSVEDALAAIGVRCS
jgi:Holliday junction resolvase